MILGYLPYHRLILSLSLLSLLVLFLAILTPFLLLHILFLLAWLLLLSLFHELLLSAPRRHLVVVMVHRQATPLIAI